MTKKEILEPEKDNYTTIHLYLVGIFWRAYQRSVFCEKFSFEELYNDICMERYLKRMGGM